MTGQKTIPALLHIDGRRMRRVASVLAWLVLFAAQPAAAETAYTRVATQYIAALGDPGSSSGTGAEAWGLWAVDPGPRGVRLSSYGALKAAAGVAPAAWTFDGSDWWLEEHGLIMEQPVFPVAPGKYMVTGDRQVQAVLTIHPRGDDGAQRWELSDNATLHDVTHLRCRAARYSPAAGANSCSPDKARQSDFPVAPGAAMPPVEGCNKQDYEVLIVIGVAADE